MPFTRIIREHVPYEKAVTITENRASTDESIKLLNEFTEKVKENIIKGVVIETNIIKCVCNYYKDEVIERRILFCLKFLLNGKEHIVNGHYDYDDARTIRLRDEFLMEFLFKRFSEAIATELMKQDIEFLKKLSGI